MNRLVIKSIICVLLISRSMTATVNKKTAFVIVPVADLVGAPILSFDLAKTVKKSYELLPLCAIKSGSSCPRVHQLLFNEKVTLLFEEPAQPNDEQEVCIELDSAFFITATNHFPQNRFWTRKKNLITADRLKKRHLDSAHFPSTISFWDPLKNSEKNILSLSMPFFDPITCQRFSAGTRFVFDTPSSNNSYQVWIFNAQNTRFIQSTIPSNKIIVNQTKTPDQAIQNFVTLLKKWAHATSSQGILPYVWGGCSFVQISSELPVETVLAGSKNNSSRVIDFKKPCSIKSGFDCAGLILRAAQTCQIPYFFKNTFTLAHFLQTLSDTQTLAEGDLIWIPGHVMIVSDTKKNMLIEARGYSHGYGIIHEIELKKVFKNISSFTELTHHYRENRLLERLDKTGKVADTFTHYKLLSLKSLWNTVKNFKTT